MKKIWELYEIWCFLIMKRLIAKVLGLDLTDRDHVHENKGEMINTFFDSQMQHDIKFDAPNGDCVSLQYQHTYNRRSKEMKTTTTEQRPDIVVIGIHGPFGNYVARPFFNGNVEPRAETEL